MAATNLARASTPALLPPPPSPPGATRARHLAVARAAVRRARPKAVDPPATDLPVARVAVDLSLAHLDRVFDYVVPEPMSLAARPGARVRVRVAGQDLAGFVLERRADSAFGGRLEPLRRVVSAEPVLDPAVARLARAVADRYAGTLADVLRLAVPPRVAGVEAQASAAHPALPPPAPQPGPWASYAGGAGYLRALATGAAPRAAWTALPGEQWPTALALTVQAALAAGRGALVVVPDARDLARLDAALTACLGPGHHVALSAELGPTERYRRWLAVRRGAVRAVVGTRASAFAPVQDLGLVAVWDDGDDVLAEPRAPYPHVREVLSLRAHQTGAALLIGGFARTPEAEQMVRSGWLRPLRADRRAVRAAGPRLLAAGDDSELARDGAAATARLPSVAWATARAALERGPVLVQVPRGGYLPGLACQRCRCPARCPACAGPLAQSAGSAAAACRWCGVPVVSWRCPHCEGTRLRGSAIGTRRTAEELGRAFPSVRVLTSGGGAGALAGASTGAAGGAGTGSGTATGTGSGTATGTVLPTMGPQPALVVATPGAEPVPADGYAAALLLDGWASLGRPDLRAGEEALRRWLGAAALVRPASRGGSVVVVADSAHPAVQALVRWDPAWFAARELADRDALGFAPAARLAAVSGTRQAVAELLDAARLPATVQQLGPVPDERGDRHRAVLRVPRRDGPALAAALRAAQAARTAGKAREPVRVQIDPLELG